MPTWLLRLLIMVSVCRVVSLQTPVSLITNLRRHFMAGCVYFSTGNNTGLDNNALYFEVQRRLAEEGIFSQAIDLEDKGRVECRNLPLFVITVDDVNRFRALGHFLGSSALDRTVWLLLLVDDERLEEMLFGVDIPFDREFLVAEKGRSGNTVTEVYRTSKSQPLQRFHYGDWSGPWPGLNLYKRRTDLQGITLRATTKNEVMLNMNSNGKTSGGMRELWSTLEQRMNFTTNLIDPAGGAWGMRHTDGSWNGMIGQLQRREVAVAVNMFTMTAERAAVVQFVLPVQETKTLAYLREPRFDDFSWKSFLAPLSSSLWQATGVCMLVLAATLAGLYFYSWRYGDESAQGVYSFSFRDSLFYMFTSLTQQGHDVTPRSPSGRVVYLLGYLISVIVITAYSAALVSFLTVQVKELPFRDLNGLLADGTYKLGVMASTAQFNMFSESNDSLMQQVYGKLMKPDPENFPATTEEGTSRLCRMKFVFLASTGFAGDVREKSNCSMVSLPDVSFKHKVAMALVRDSPYLGFINHILLNMRSAGIVRHMFKRSQIQLQDTKETSLRSVHLENVVPILSVWACGVGIALLLLAVEITQYHLFRRLQLTRDARDRSLFRRRPSRWNLLQTHRQETFLSTNTPGKNRSKGVSVQDMTAFEPWQ